MTASLEIWITGLRSMSRTVHGLGQGDVLGHEQNLSGGGEVLQQKMTMMTNMSTSGVMSRSAKVPFLPWAPLPRPCSSAAGDRLACLE
jgi:hypothetical protein